RDGDLTAVLHPLPDIADRALSLVKAGFDPAPAKLNEGNIFSHLLETAPEGSILSREGDVKKGEKAAARHFERSYFQNYVAHAPMETHTALAAFEGKRITVWASTQTPFSLKEEVAHALSMPSGDVRVITPFVGGGFGGKTWNAQGVEAARLAKVTGKPVQVCWTREEEFFNDSFMPAAVVKIRSGLDGKNRIAYWDYRVYFAGERCAPTFYDIPAQTTATHGSAWGSAGAHPFSTGAWRGPAANTNTFARESHMDFMAAEAGTDPVAFRLAHLRNNARMAAVLEKAAAAFSWAPSKTPPGRGRGVACVDYLGTYVTAMAEVEADPRSGEIKVNRVLCAQDMGQVINPEGAALQMEGCMMMGLGYPLSEMIHFRGGEILDTNFDTYRIPRFSWMPRIETVLVDNPSVPPQGGGEPAVTCMGAVLANAVSDALKIRIIELPMTPEKVKKAVLESEKK
ncbi:MAG TPA: molybdopterin cofactor-binding domain-containing protein, partial [Thermodesulfobacteriota bacterium]|nr:molybdopterin cofactor-binding domain-containing protein [Thermodesulfobacteriota bacterium]